MPVVLTGDAQTKVHVYGAVAPWTGRTYSHLSPTLGKGACATVLRQWLRYDRDKRLVVIPDRAEPHKGAIIEAVMYGADGRLMLLPQAPYASELHPEERLWKWMRRVVTHNHWFATLPEEIQAIRDVFCSLAARKGEVRQLCALTILESLVALL